MYMVDVNSTDKRAVRLCRCTLCQPSTKVADAHTSRFSRRITVATEIYSRSLDCVSRMGVPRVPITYHILCVIWCCVFVVFGKLVGLRAPDAVVDSLRPVFKMCSMFLEDSHISSEALYPVSRRLYTPCTYAR